MITMKDVGICALASPKGRKRCRRASYLIAISATEDGDCGLGKRGGSVLNAHKTCRAFDFGRELRRRSPVSIPMSSLRHADTIRISTVVHVDNLDLVRYLYDARTLFVLGSRDVILHACPSSSSSYSRDTRTSIPRQHYVRPCLPSFLNICHRLRLKPLIYPSLYYPVVFCIIVLPVCRSACILGVYLVSSSS